MEVLEAARTMNLPDPRVWVAGDWHGNVGWVQRLLPALGRIDRQIETLLHVGDFWMSTDTVDYWAKRTGIRRVLVTLGNHEPYGTYTPLLAAHPGCAVRVSEVVWLLPRPWQFEIMGRAVVSLGGATSVDREWRQSGVDWWSDEEITDHQVESALPMVADIMLCHESPEGSPVLAAQRAMAANRPLLSESALTSSAKSRERVGRVWRTVRPNLLIHGHLHVSGRGLTSDSREVVALSCDGMRGNIALLDIASLSVQIVDYPS
ncbi:metallophosphoesterase [Microbacterium sediminicola]